MRLPNAFAFDIHVQVAGAILKGNQVRALRVLLDSSNVKLTALFSSLPSLDTLSAPVASSPIASESKGTADTAVATRGPVVVQSRLLRALLRVAPPPPPSQPPSQKPKMYDDFTSPGGDDDDGEELRLPDPLSGVPADALQKVGLLPMRCCSC